MSDSAEALVRNFFAKRWRDYYETRSLEERVAAVMDPSK